MRWRRWAQVSLRSWLVLVALVAVSIWGLRQWAAYHTFVTHFYPVHDIVTGQNNLSSYQPLIKEIEASVQPWTWRSDGGSGSMTPFFRDRTLIVRNNRIALGQVEALLQRKRLGRKPGS